MSFGSSVGLCWQSHFASEKLGSTEKALSHSSRHAFCLKYKKYSAKIFSKWHQITPTFHGVRQCDKGNPSLVLEDLTNG